MIAIGGQKNNGKDALADLLLARLPAWQKAAFADPLKDVVCQLYGVSRAFIEEWKNRPDPPPGWLLPMRQLLQDLGGLARSYDPYVFARRLSDGSASQVACDMRHINEATEMVVRGHTTVLVWRPGYENNISHPSEQELTVYRRLFIDSGVRGATGHAFINYFVVNDGTPLDMLGQLVPLLNQLGVSS